MRIHSHTFTHTHTYTRTHAPTIQIQYNDYYLTNNFYNSPKLTLLLLFTLINFGLAKLPCHAMHTCININIQPIYPVTQHLPSARPPTHSNTHKHISQYTRSQFNGMFFLRNPMKIYNDLFLSEVLSIPLNFNISRLTLTAPPSYVKTAELLLRHSTVVLVLKCFASWHVKYAFIY